MTIEAANAPGVQSPPETATGARRSFVGRIGKGLGRAWRAVRPGTLAQRGAAYGLIAAVLLLGTFSGINTVRMFGDAVMSVVLAPIVGTDPRALPSRLYGALLGFVVAALLLLIGAPLMRGVRRIVMDVQVLLSGAALVAVIFAVLSASGYLMAAPGALPLALAVLLAAGVLGAAITVVARGGLAGMTLLRRLLMTLAVIASAAFLVYGAAWLAGPGDAPPDDPRLEMALAASPVPAPLDAPNPAEPGSYAVQSLTYGSGTDLHRPEFGAEADLITDTVDGTPFLNAWTPGFMDQAREGFWNFDADALPLNGRVWYPEGDGPFPLALIVHGAHAMEDFSDPGYAYLGDLLASRGIILVSVDENFLNGSIMPADPPTMEMDARAWILLEHLRVWREWNAERDNPFYGRVDLDRVALLGHSRGGEAAAVAAAFNRLPRFPDNAYIEFDYNFGIRAVVAIAPCDGQYWPGGRQTPLQDVDYLVLQGSADSDVYGFTGIRQYNRVRFSGQDYRFKAAVYIAGANHGQFNTVWGDNDFGGGLDTVRRSVLNLAALLPADDQRQAAQVFISAFLEAALHDRTEYLPLFRDPRAGDAWLPDALTVTQFEDSTFRVLADFEGDLDVTTGSAPGVTLENARLSTWREGNIGLRGDFGYQENRAVWLGWDQDVFSGTPRFVVNLPQDWTTDPGDVLTFALADANERPPVNADGEPIPLDVTIQLWDAHGTRAALPLSTFEPLLPPLTNALFKSGALDLYGGGGVGSWEAVLQTYELPLASFAEVEPDFDPAGLREIRFVFDHAPAGTIILDRVGLHAGSE